MNAAGTPIVKTVSGLATKLISVIILLVVLAATAVVLRIISIHRLQRKWKLHDAMTCLSLFCLVGYVIDIIIGICHGSFGLKITQVPLSNLVVAFKTYFVSQFFWSAGVTSFRFAVVLLYIEIFAKPVFYWSAVSTATVVIAYYLACVVTILASCQPISLNWDKTITGTCVNLEAIALFSAAFNMALDIWVVCLPLPIIWDLNMARKRKIAVSATFALGLAIAGLNLGRLIQTLRCDQANFTYCVLPAYMIVVGEMSVGIMVACVPTFGPVFFPSRLKTNTRYQDRSKEWSKPFSKNSGRSPLGCMASDTAGGSFHTLEDNDIELERALQTGDGYQAGAGRGSAHSEEPNHVIAANEIGVRKDLIVVETLRKS
ncbi:hypothetical protein EYC80_009607 [Monilinia laxa]|uniref:Rhodopsin domain-containing protein n=1 Tax=Monilinia laxa TaxID=61186 RepID=A0A5N6JYK0_MONLA|nr:hypothetical protein EYC80_009607 [Monilinia laxa]